MSKLIVLGNGFDIAHGLLTKYSNFMEYLSTYDSQTQFFSGNYAHYNLSPQDQEKQRFYKAIIKYIPEQDLWCSFEEALAMLDEEQLQDDNTCYLLGYGDDNWRDSAHHDFQYMIDEALSFAADIPNYFSQWIRCIDTRVIPKISSDIINNDCLFLTFNYTDTLETSYGVPPERILYIHGKALRGDRLILGHHENALIQDEPIPHFLSEVEREFYYDNLGDDVRVVEAKEIIKSYFRRTYKDTLSIIRHNQAFFNSLTSVNEVYIFGHSLSEIDLDYFIEIKNMFLRLVNGISPIITVRITVMLSILHKF